MSGSIASGLKTRETLLDRYGKDYYRNIGKLGGTAKVPKGFALNRKLASEAGTKAGKISKRGYTFIKTEGEYNIYIAQVTGEVVKYKHDSNVERETNNHG